MTRGRTLAIAAIAAVVLGAAALALFRGTGSSGLGLDIGRARAPSGVRVRVQVLNATGTTGLAARATRVLRDAGFDVVETGTVRDKQDSTTVLDRSGHPDWAQAAADIMGGARVTAQPDSSRYLDVTVLIGASWRPPPDPLSP